jgi:hypothetical protein
MIAELRQRDASKRDTKRAVAQGGPLQDVPRPQSIGIPSHS